MKVLFVTDEDVTTGFLFEHVTNDNEPNIEAHAVCAGSNLAVASSVKETLLAHGYDENAIRVSHWSEQDDFVPDFVIYLGKDIQSTDLPLSFLQPTNKVVWPVPEARWQQLSGSKLTQHLTDLFKTILCLMGTVDLLIRSRVSKPIIQHHIERLAYLV